MEEAIVVAVYIDPLKHSIIEKRGEYLEVKESYILPKRIAPMDSIEKVKEVYGQPSQEGTDATGFAKFIMYESKDGKKSLEFMNINGSITAFRMKLDYDSEFSKANAGAEDFSAKLDESAYININGHKITMNSSTKEVFENLELENISKSSGSILDPKLDIILANKEITVFTKFPGYDFYNISFRLLNTSDKTIKIIDSKIVGVEVEYLEGTNYTKPSPGDFPSPGALLNIINGDHLLSVVGPYGVKIRNTQKSEFDKLPKDNTTFEASETAGEKATVKNGDMVYEINSHPDGDKGLKIDKISMRFEKKNK